MSDNNNTKGDKKRTSYEIGKKIDYPIEMLDYSYPQHEKIFDTKSNYYVVSHVSDIWEEDSKLCIEVTLDNLQKATILLSEIDKVGINMKFSAMELPINIFNQHIDHTKKQTIPKYKIINNEIIIPMAGKKFIISKKPFNIEIINSKKEIEFELNRRKGFPWWGGFINPPLGFKTHQGSNKLRPFLSWAIHSDENFYGLGETFSKFEKTSVEKVINNVGTSANSNNGLTYASIPYLVSTNNWGILVNTSARTIWDVGSSTADAGALLTDDEYLDIYFFTGKNMKEIVSKYTLLTRRIKPIPERAYGTYLGRLYYHDREEAENELKKAQKYKFPIDVIHIDPKWLKQRYNKSCNFKRHTERWGEFKDLFKDFYETYDAGTSIWINPYIQRDNETFFKQAIENDYLVKSKITKDGYFHPWTGPEKWQLTNYLIDFTNEKATEWWKEYVREIGRDGAFTLVADYGEGVTDDAIFSNGLTGKEMRHYYTYLYTKAQFEAFEEVKGKGNVMNISRPGYIGSQHYTGKWGGDSTSTWPELKMQIQAGLSVAFNGVNFWGGDLGGFLGIPTDDLLIRWLQVGLLMPFSRFHGTGPREPWNYSERATKVALKMVKMRRALIPYFKLNEATAIKTGLTTIRPLVLEYQNDKVTRNIETQFMIGDSLMVAPIMAANKKENDVYFPEGIWYEYENSVKKYEGNKRYVLPVKLEDTPIFIKAGTVLVMFEKGDYKMSDIAKQKLVVKAYLGSISKGKYEFTLDGKKIIINYNFTKTDVTVTIKGWDNNKIIKIK